jgi:hypothetical protein
LQSRKIQKIAHVCNNQYQYQTVIDKIILKITDIDNFLIQTLKKQYGGCNYSCPTVIINGLHYLQSYERYNIKNYSPVNDPNYNDYGRLFNTNFIDCDKVCNNEKFMKYKMPRIFFDVIKAYSAYTKFESDKSNKSNFEILNNCNTYFSELIIDKIKKEEIIKKQEEEIKKLKEYIKYLK